MNPFTNKLIACTYDEFYETEFGKQIDIEEKKAITKLLYDVKKADMLELGCGTGHWTKFFSSLNFNIIAVDISIPMINIAISKKIPSASFMFADAQNLPFKNNAFSVVASIAMLEFVENPTKALYEMYRLTKPNGNILLGFLNADSILFKNRTENSIFKHAHLFTKEEIYKLLKSFGKLSFVEAVYINENSNICTFSNEQNSAFIACKVDILKA